MLGGGDLHHVGAEQREQFGAEGAGPGLAEAEHANAG